jgi:hypothetical protein
MKLNLPLLPPPLLLLLLLLLLPRTDFEHRVN